MKIKNCKIYSYLKNEKKLFHLSEMMEVMKSFGLCNIVWSLTEQP